MKMALINDDEAAGAIMSAITRLSYQQLDIIQVSMSDMCILHEDEHWICFRVVNFNLKPKTLKVRQYSNLSSGSRLTALQHAPQCADSQLGRKAWRLR